MSSSTTDYISTNNFGQTFQGSQKIICSLLQEAILSLCHKTYSASAVEVDGIICISVLDSGVQDVVKIHKMLNTGKYSHDDPPVPELPDESRRPWYSEHDAPMPKLSDESRRTWYHEQPESSLQFTDAVSSDVCDPQSELKHQSMSNTLIGRQGNGKYRYPSCDSPNKQILPSVDSSDLGYQGISVSETRPSADSSVSGYPSLYSDDLRPSADSSISGCPGVSSGDTRPSVDSSEPEYHGVLTSESNPTIEYKQGASVCTISHTWSIGQSGKPGREGAANQDVKDEYVRKKKGVKRTKVSPSDLTKDTQKDLSKPVTLTARKSILEMLKKRVSASQKSKDGWQNVAECSLSPSSCRTGAGHDGDAGVHVKVEPADSEARENTVHSDDFHSSVDNQNYLYTMNLPDSSNIIKESPERTETDFIDYYSQINVKKENTEHTIQNAEFHAQNQSLCLVSDEAVNPPNSTWHQTSDKPFSGGDYESSYSETESEADTDLNGYENPDHTFVQSAVDKYPLTSKLLKSPQKTDDTLSKKTDSPETHTDRNRSDSPSYTGSLVDRLPFISFQELFPQTSSVAHNEGEDIVFPVHTTPQSDKEEDQKKIGCHSYMTRLASGSKTQVLFGGIDLDQDVYDDEEEDEDTESDSEIVESVPAKKPRLGVPPSGRGSAGKPKPVDPSRLVACYVCGVPYSKSYLRHHLWKQHAINSTSTSSNSPNGE